MGLKNLRQQSEILAANTMCCSSTRSFVKRSLQLNSRRLSKGGGGRSQQQAQYFPNAVPTALYASRVDSIISVCCLNTSDKARVGILSSPTKLIILRSKGDDGLTQRAFKAQLYTPAFSVNPRQGLPLPEVQLLSSRAS